MSEPMKTPDEIKKGLEICFASPTPEDGCDRCPYISERMPTVTCGTSLKNDVLAYIHRLEAELAAAKQERDALHCDLSDRADACDVCKHGYFCKNDCRELFGYDRCSFEWRGVCSQNTEVKGND